MLQRQDNNNPKTDTPDDDLSQRAADGFLINGSMVNGATTPFAQSFAFGNNRNGGDCITAESASSLAIPLWMPGLFP